MGGDNMREFFDLLIKQKSSTCPINKNENDFETNTPIEKLPEDLIDKIFILLPTTDGIRAECISKKWQIRKNLCTQCFNFDDAIMRRRKPWYFTYKQSERHVIGFAYNSEAESWHKYDFQYLKAKMNLSSLNSPHFEPDRCSFSASNGLVCIMNVECYTEYIFVCNPILKLGLMLPQLPIKPYEYCLAVALSVDIKSRSYCVVVVKALDDDLNNDERELRIELYESKKNNWTNIYDGWLADADGGFECTICNNMLYYLITSKGPTGAGQPRQAVVPYDMEQPNFEHALTDLGIMVPGVLTCVRLMNLHDKLIMIGGRESDNHPGSIEEICIWELCGKLWKEITRLPEEMMSVFQDFDGSFPSKGSGDFVYVHAYSLTDLAIFNMRKKTWQLVTGSPVSHSKDLYDHFEGICFEPRLDIRP